MSAVSLASFSGSPSYWFAKKVLTKGEREKDEEGERGEGGGTATVLSVAGSFDSPVILSLATTLSATARAASRIVVAVRDSRLLSAADWVRQNVVILLRACQLCVSVARRSSLAGA